MQIIPLTEESFERCVDAAIDTLSQGGVFVYPTETVYGLGCDAFNDAAVTQLIQYKGRQAGRSLPVLVSSQDVAEDIVELTPTARSLYATQLPGPLTVISQSKGIVDPRLESEVGALGVRISSHSFVSEVTARYGRPIVGTSAGVGGLRRVYEVEALVASLSTTQQGALNLIIDAGELPHVEPSMVIDTTQDAQDLVRAGTSEYEIVSTSEDETNELAARLLHGLNGELANGPVVFALEGEMGAGKTHFAKGIAKALDITEVVSSPTYILMKEYEGPQNTLLHLDLWRTPKITLEELDLASQLQPGVVCVIEWAGPVLDQLSEIDAVGYHLVLGEVPEGRRIGIRAL